MANELKLPLVEFLVDIFEEEDLSNIKIIGAQHILETTHAMFRSLYRVGLQPKNISLIGKCYSTCREVYEEMLADGIDISESSFTYSSHSAFDEQYSREVQKFLTIQMDDLTKSKYDRIIVLDDGGKCINFFNKTNKLNAQVIAIEQTSAGYNEIKNKELHFPVINVARSPAKLNLESSMIAQAAAERLYQSLKRRQLSPNRALIIGGGPIGQAMKSLLNSDIEIDIYDRNYELSDFNVDLSSVIHLYPLIVGCTGRTSIPEQYHSKLAHGTVLVSVSSSDREFDSVHFRKKLAENKYCHEDLLIQGKLLVQNGFPVNFDGERENIDLEKIQLTIALITAAIFQAQNLAQNHPSSIIQADIKLEAKIVVEFFNNQKEELLVTYAK